MRGSARNAGPGELMVFQKASRLATVPALKTNRLRSASGAFRKDLFLEG
jgi:hypothetical protein